MLKRFPVIFFLLLPFLSPAQAIAWGKGQKWFADTAQLYLGDAIYNYRVIYTYDKSGEPVPEKSKNGYIPLWSDNEEVAPVEMAYWEAAEEDSFYAMAGSVDLFSYVFIDFTVDLCRIDSVRKNRGNKELAFSNCYIRSVQSGTVGKKKAVGCNVKFTRCMIEDVVLWNLTFHQPVTFFWTAFEYASVDSCAFNRIFNFHSETPGWDTSGLFSGIYFTNTVFNDTARIGGTSLTVQFNAFETKGLLSLYDYYSDSRDSVPPKFYIDNGRITGALKLLGREASYYFGGGVTLQGQIDLTGLMASPVVANGQGLKSLIVMENSVLTVNEYSHPESFHLSLSTLKNTSIDFRGRDSVYTLLHYEHLSNVLQSLRDEVSGREISDVKRKSDVTDWIDYQQTFHRRHYLAEKKDKRLSEYFELAWLNIVQATVRSGFKGEGRFFLWLAAVVLAFTLYYMLACRKLVCGYVEHDTIATGRQLELDFARKRNFADLAIDFFKCFWFSFVLFITPKFHRQYFKFPRRLLVAVLLEWSIGLFLMIIFVIYIATRYPFVKTLFGI